MPDDRLKLDSFSAGESIRMFQTKIDGQPVMLDAFNSNEAKPILLSSDDLDFHYFMKDATEVRFENTFSSGFIEFCKDSINNDESDLYYNKLNIGLLSSVSMAQAGRKTYVLGYDKYEENPAESLSTYSLYQLYSLDSSDPRSSLNDAIRDYIGSTYSSAYYDASHYVDCKSVPVYSVNDDLLKSLEIITFKDRSDVLAFIDKFRQRVQLKQCLSVDVLQS